VLALPADERVMFASSLRRCSGAPAVPLCPGPTAPLCKGASGAGGYGGAPDAEAARSTRLLRRRRRRFLGAKPAAARRVSSAWLASKASNTRKFRTAKQQVTNKKSGTKPIRRHQPRGNVVAGGVFYGRVGPFCTGPAGVGPPPQGRAVIIFLGSFGVDMGRHGDGLLPTAGRRVLGRGQDRGPLVGQRHRLRPQRAAQFAEHGRAGGAKVAVFVVREVRAR
jgi:hypothetical protein